MAPSNGVLQDVVLIGGGVMSATLGTMLQRVQPDWEITVLERLASVGEESSNAWNNAGTGHAALCELNYTPADASGNVSPDKAVAINEQFQVSRQFWASLIREGTLKDPSSFINPIAHMSLVWGEDNARYLKARYEALKPQPLFSELEFSTNRAQLSRWAPLTMEGRDPEQVVAASRVEGGTDIDFGSLTRQLIGSMRAHGARIKLEHEVADIRRGTDGRWEVKVKDLRLGTVGTIRAKFVFIGAGGGALHLLQRTGIPEGKGFGGFPVSGQFLKCSVPEIVERHEAKVYGQASVGAPPMSVPHLDTRVVDGRRTLLFGPYAGFSTKFLKTGSYLDLPTSVKPSNLFPMVKAGLDNIPLTRYLISEVLKKRSDKDLTLRDFMPTADGSDWELLTAGQRVQVIKKDGAKGGVLQFGTEVITSADGSVGALLGASPGASTAAPIMVDVLRRCFPREFGRWLPALKDMIPALGVKLNEDPALADEILEDTARVLGLDRIHSPAARP